MTPASPSPVADRPRWSVRGAAWAALKFVVFAVLYITFHRLGKRVDFVDENVRVFYPQAGVAMAGLLLLGPRYWPAVFLSSLYVSYSDLARRPGIAAVNTVGFMGAFAVANALAAATGAWLLRRVRGFNPSMVRVSDVTAFLVYAVVLAPALNATVAVAGFVAFGNLLQVPADDTGRLVQLLWMLRWFGHAISILVIAPFFLAWSRPPSRVTLQRLGEIVLLCSVVVSVCLAAFTSRSPLFSLQYSLSFAPFPFVIWAALRFGQRGAATATLIISAVAILGTSTQSGPFAYAGTSVAAPVALSIGRWVPVIPEGLLVLQIYLAALALSAHFLASAVQERRAAVERLSRSQEELRALSARLQEAREEERATISREIHDELGQQLTGIKMMVHALSRQAGRADASLAERAGDITRLADEAVGTVRRIATDLRPGILDDLGIVASMQWLVQEFSRRTGVSARFATSADEVQADDAARIALFRILQEALTNVTRHAQASHVDVSLDIEDAQARLVVEDDGRGIGDRATAPAGEGPRTLGLVGMRERARLVGGSLGIGPRARGGTRVVAVIPLDHSGVARP